MVIPDRHLYTAEIVHLDRPVNLIAIDLAEHQVIRTTPQKLVGAIGRERLASRLDYYLGMLFTFVGLVPLVYGGYNLVTTGGNLETPIAFGSITVFFGVGGILLRRSERLMQRTNAIEEALKSQTFNASSSNRI